MLMGDLRNGVTATHYTLSTTRTAIGRGWLASETGCSDTIVMMDRQRTEPTDRHTTDRREEL